MPMEDPKLYQEALSHIHDEFEIEQERSEDNMTRQQMLDHLQLVVTEHLMRSPERLHLALYRMDVNEMQFREALSGPTPAESVAVLILDRELEKVETRKLYAPNWANIPDEDKL